MSTTIEAQGRTVDEAIQIALNQLGASRDKVEIEIVHHPRRGFLGIGARRAKVRATLRQGIMLDGEEFDMSGGGLQEKPRRRRRRGGKGRSGRGEGENESPPTERTEVDRDRSRDSDRGRRGGDRPVDSGESRQAGGGGRGRDDRRGRGDQPRGRDETRGVGDPQRGGRGDQRDRRQQPSGGGAGQGGGRPRGGRPGQDARSRTEQLPAQTSPAVDTAADRAATPSPTPRPTPPEPQRTPRTEETSSQPQEPSSASIGAEPVDPEAIRERAQELVAELITGMGFTASVTSWVDEGSREVVVSVHSESEGLLIGRRGQTLDAIEHIVNRMVVRGDGAGEGRVLLDIGDYRRRRRETLIELADRLRTRALGEQRTVQVSPMSPRDRKFFQQSLAADSAVEVRALGAGFYRRMIVAPAGMGPAALAEAEAAARNFADDDTVDDFGEAFSPAQAPER